MRHASARASQSNLVCLFVYVVSAFAAVVVSGAAAAADPLFDQAFDALAHQEYADSLRAAGFRGSVRPSAYRGRPAGAGGEALPLTFFLEQEPAAAGGGGERKRVPDFEPIRTRPSGTTYLPAESDAAGPRPINLAKGAPLWEPASAQPGMFGPGIKQWSHDVPTLRYGNSPYMQKNPYWNYFRNVWGDAPFIDGNFQLWTQGLFKGFNNPDHMIQSQKTLGLPAWMHYYDPAYDPLLDQPYPSMYSLFSDPYQPAKPEPHQNGVDVYDDCTEPLDPDGARPCGVRESEYKSLTARNWKETDHKIAMSFGPQAYATGYVKVGWTWGKNDNAASESDRPKNIPPPPPEAADAPEWREGWSKSAGTSSAQVDAPGEAAPDAA